MTDVYAQMLKLSFELSGMGRSSVPSSGRSEIDRARNGAFVFIKNQTDL